MFTAELLIRDPRDDSAANNGFSPHCFWLSSLMLELNPVESWAPFEEFRDNFQLIGNRVPSPKKWSRCGQEANRLSLLLLGPSRRLSAKNWWVSGLLMGSGWSFYHRARAYVLTTKIHSSTDFMTAAVSIFYQWAAGEPGIPLQIYLWSAPKRDPNFCNRPGRSLWLEDTLGCCACPGL